jgi:hypothetical protein
MGRIIPYMTWKNKSHVPNHQPADSFDPSPHGDFPIDETRRFAVAKNGYTMLYEVMCSVNMSQNIRFYCLLI